MHHKCSCSATSAAVFSCRLLLLCTLILAANSPAAAAASAAGDPLICIVIRTYWGHGTYGDSSLINLLHSLQKQTHSNWRALLLTMDNRPFPDLHHIVLDMQDERIHVFAEWIAAKYAPRNPKTNNWSNGYHTHLYNLTDIAIRACPRNTEWLVTSNGDNDYDPDFLATVVKQGQQADVVAFDYYSRFQRPTGMPCLRFAAGPGIPPCKENGMAWCQTDLAANVYRYQRWIQEDMQYGRMDSGVGVSHDGRMADLIQKKGWPISWVRHRCLVEHAPSPQKCAAIGHYWDDTDPGTWASAGGHCLDKTAAQKLLKDPGIEVVEVNVTHDGSSFKLAAQGAALPLKCLRRADKNTWESLRKFFPSACDSSVDRIQHSLQQLKEQQPLVQGGAAGVVQQQHVQAVQK